jgi:uncharacterized protein YndB with AHSA1/START domain
VLRYVVMIVGLLVAVVALVLIIGSALPEKHTVTREATYRATPEQLFTLIRNASDYPSWQKAVSKVELLPAIDGKPRMRETNSGQAITYELSDIVPNQGMTSRIADAKLPFGGSWTYEFAPGVTRDLTTLRITENGEVYNPVFRFVSKFVMGHSATIDKYLAAVATRYPRLPASD